MSKDKQSDTTTESVVADTEPKQLSKKEQKALEFKQKLEASKKSKKAKSKSKDGKDGKDAKDGKDSKSEKSKDSKTEKSKDSKSDKTKTKEKSTTAEKRKRESSDDGASTTTKTSEDNSNDTESKPKKKRRKGKSSSSSESKGARFILFVGNLPFKYDVKDLETHFQSCKPDVIRPRDQKGFAFVEYAGDDASRRMTIALSKLHHSMFMNRKINVELTAGGGGNTANRKQKIQQKNAKLEESRKADFEKQEKERKEKAMRKHTKFTEGGESKPEPENESSIHPSRRRLIKE